MTTSPARRVEVLPGPARDHTVTPFAWRADLDTRALPDPDPVPAAALFRLPWDEHDDYAYDEYDEYLQLDPARPANQHQPAPERPAPPPPTPAPSSPWPRPGPLALPAPADAALVPPPPIVGAHQSRTIPATEGPSTQRTAARRPSAQATAAELWSSTLLTRRDQPRTGWRRIVATGTAGAITLSPSRAEQARQQLVARIRRTLHGPRNIAVMSAKGGASKTTTAACLGCALAETRGDHVGVVDANPDAGTLLDRLVQPGTTTTGTIRDLIDHIDAVDSLTSLDPYLSLAGRLKVLASEQDPAASEALTAQEYEDVLGLLQRYINIVITDSGTGLTHPTVAPMLRHADGLVIVGSMTIDGASRASYTLDWLEGHGFADAAAGAIVVLSGSVRRRNYLDVTQVRDHFEARARAVVEIPHDTHLAAGGPIDFDQLGRRARDAYLTLAAHVVDQLA